MMESLATLRLVKIRQGLFRSLCREAAYLNLSFQLMPKRHGQVNFSFGIQIFFHIQVVQMKEKGKRNKKQHGYQIRGDRGHENMNLHLVRSMTYPAITHADRRGVFIVSCTSLFSQKAYSRDSCIMCCGFSNILIIK